jgi:hypothetical protein
MGFLRIGLSMIAATTFCVLPAWAADLETQVVDKNCYIEVFDDDNYDMDDAHYKIQGPKEFASLKDLDTLITDSEPGPDLAAALEEAGVDVVIA